MSFLQGLTKPFFILAPMDDVTDTVFRQIVQGTAPADLYFTEFVNVDGLQSPGRPKLLPKVLFSDREGPLIIQLWGKTPGNYYKTARQIVSGALAKDSGSQGNFVGVDINMGCPAKPIIQNGCCSALINNRELASEIISSTQQGVIDQLTEEGRADEIDNFPVSVKTRLGWNEIDLSWHEFLLKHKLNMLTIHGRTKKEMSKVPTHWDEVGKISEMRTALAPDTLVVGNGDVLTKEQGRELAKKYKLDGIMIGRGVFDDPYVFADVSPWADKSPTQKIELYRQHVKLFAKTWTRGERKVHTLNKFCKVYVSGFDGAKELREKLMAAESTDELLQLLALQG